MLDLVELRIFAETYLIIGDLSHINNRMDSFEAINILETKISQVGSCEIVLHFEEISKFINEMNDVFLVF